MAIALDRPMTLSRLFAEHARRAKPAGHPGLPVLG